MVKPSIEAIEIEMKRLGDGARGIVFGDRGEDVEGHFFNVVNRDGQIYFVDGQSGGRAYIDPKFQTFELMLTSKGGKK